MPIDIGDPDHGSLRFYINDQYIQNYSGYWKLNDDHLLSLLQKKLDEFIEIFNLYLDLIVSQLLPKNIYSIEGEDWISPNKIYSFNYTNTFQRIYDSVDVEYLHGSHGVDQNIVLGVSDLEDATLKKIKAYGFTKYHQKLFKDTDYIFLDGFKNKILKNEEVIINLNTKLDKINNLWEVSALKKQIDEKISQRKINLNFFIWGHSLDASDQDYIKDLFSLNDDMDRNVRVTVYYFDKPAKFSLLNNLLAILGKDKVEQWMKNKWLVFKPNPEVQFLAEENSDTDRAS